MVTHRDHHVLLNLKVLSSHGIQASASADAPDHALPLAPHDVALADYTIWSALVYRESLDSSLLEHAARLALGKFPQLAGQLRLRKVITKRNIPKAPHILLPCNAHDRLGLSCIDAICQAC